MNINKEKLLEEFKKHVYKYDMSDENIARKYYHSIRVMDFAEKIAISENLPESEIEVSIIIGLLHDYARFEQWKKFKTYRDNESVDHGDLAVELLFDNQEIEKFYNNTDNYDKIYDGIKYHNKFCIPQNINKKNLTVCKIIRDADKLDILNLIINKELKTVESEDDISQKVEQDFLNCKHTDRKDIKNDNDRTIMKIAMLYDINYAYSYKYIIENNILWRIFENIKNKNKFKKYFDFLEKYLLNKVKEII